MLLRRLHTPGYFTGLVLYFSISFRCLIECYHILLVARTTRPRWDNIHTLCEGLCYRSSLQNDDRKQESIQVGCIPSAAAAVCWGASGPGGSCSRGVSVPGSGACSWRAGVAQHARGGGGSCSGVRGVSQHALRQTPLCEQNERQV